MKHISFLLVLSLISFDAFSASGGEQIKPFNIGLGTYRTVIAYDNALATDDELSGGALSFGYAVSDQFALRATYFSLEHDDDSALESTGYDLLAYLGTSLATPGFKAYIGGGYFSDEWKLGAFSKTFSGLQLSGGIGYNWNAIALDFILGVRDASDYEDFVNQNSFIKVSAAAVTGSLLVSFRF
jgi:hypothetical protein